MNMTTCHSIGGHPSEDLEVFSSDNPVSPVHSKPLVTPDGRRMGINLSFSFEDRWGLLEAGVGSSSIEVEGEAVLVVSAPKATGVVEVARTAGEPLPVMRTVFFPIFDSGSSFFALILAYMFLLNLVVISARGMSIKKKKKKKCMLNVRTALMSLRLTLFPSMLRFLKTKAEGSGPRQ